MATVSSLFGSGLSEQELANQLLEQRASNFAQMPQEQRLAMMGYKAGNQVGTGLAGAFGVDVQDPMVKRATMLRQMAQQFDTTGPEGLRQLAQAMRNVDPDMALKVAQQADAMELAGAKIGSEQALASQRMRERAGADPVEQFIRVNAKEFTPASLKAYKDSGGDPSVLDPKDKANTQVIEAGGNSLLINKQTGDVIKNLGAAPQRGTNVNVLPAKANDILKFRNDFNTTLKPFRDSVNAADSGITLIDDAIKNKNFTSAAAATRQLAKAVGETQISNQDVKSIGADPSLIGGAADILSRLAQGTPTEDTLKKMRQVLQIVKKKNQALEDQEIDQTRKLAKQSGQFSDTQIEEVFNLRNSSKKTYKTAGGNTVVIED